MAQDRHIVSVIISTIGRATLARCRAALAEQTRPPDEVITVMDRDRRGAAWARNDGLRQAKGDLIAFIDDDAIAPPDWLERLVQAIDTYGAAAAGGTYRETDGLLDAIRRRNPVPVTEQVDQGGLVGNAGNILICRAWLETCLAEDGHAFNPDFTGSGEDWELIWRLRKRGAKMVYVPNPVTHLRRTSLWQHCRHSFQRGAGIALLYKLYHSDPGTVVAQNSWLWGRDGNKSKPRWGRAFWEKIVGPFDVRSFSQRRHFWQFWIGEKCQALGFFWATVRHHDPDESRTRRCTLWHSAPGDTEGKT
jgi:glycosyltransferase involved in cell wall biosynthesis